MTRGLATGCLLLKEGASVVGGKKKGLRKKSRTNGRNTGNVPRTVKGEGRGGGRERKGRERW